MEVNQVKRREFITLLGGAGRPHGRLSRRRNTASVFHMSVCLWDSPKTTRWRRPTSQPSGRVCSNLDCERGAFRIDLRYAAANADRMRKYAAELVRAAPEVILAQTTPVTAALLRETRKIPIVFVIVSDPVGSGFVETLSHPGGNATGFVNLEASLVEKWVELLKEIAPPVTRTAMMFNPETAP
jgi:putative tryptophan/tyrosine transport system substrate-binding protein